MTSQSLWQDRALTVGHGMRYVLGPLTVYVLRMVDEWQFFYRHAETALTTEESAEEVHLSRAEIHEIAEQHEQVRVSDSSASEADHLSLRFVPADRPFLSRPLSPVHILANSTAHWYVTTPVWVQFIRNPGNTVIHTLPTWRPADSWFGPPTGAGPLCYASKTRAYHVLADLPHHAMRMVTQTILHNSGSTLEVQRIIVPTPHLQVWINDDGRLWTQSVSIQRGVDGQLTDASVLQRPPENAGQCKRISTGYQHDVNRSSLRGLMDSLFR